MITHHRSNTTCLPLRSITNNHVGTNNTTSEAKLVQFRIIKSIGAGSFGKVYMVQNKNKQIFAMKVVAQKSGVKQRQLEILRAMNHYNIVELKTFYTEPVPAYSIGGTTHYLNLIMQLLPQSLYQVIRKNRNCKSGMDKNLIKIYAFQLFKAFAYLEKQRICHRDLKPSNILIDQRKGILKVCDFGSAKRIGIGQKNVSYICSRYYRAPQLLLGIQTYDMKVDVWSIGCILVQMLTCFPLFPGQSSIEQMIQIIKIIGSPSIQCLQNLYQTKINSTFPKITSIPWKSFLNQYNPDQLLLDLIQKILIYDPSIRLSSSQSLNHPYFQDIRDDKYSSYIQNNPNIFVFDKN